MSKYSKFNIVYRLQKWMDSVPGQTFLNYAYSWGASVVILGTLFKLTHLPGAHFFLFLGRLSTDPSTRLRTVWNLIVVPALTMKIKLFL